MLRLLLGIYRKVSLITSWYCLISIYEKTELDKLRQRLKLAVCLTKTRTVSMPLNCNLAWGTKPASEGLQGTFQLGISIRRRPKTGTREACSC